MAPIIDHEDELAFARFDDDGGPQHSTRPSKTPLPGQRDAAVGANVRLSLAPALYQGTLDGGWWPRSLDVTAELTALVAALPPRVGPVDRVSLNLAAWPAHPKRVPLDTHVLRLGWFTALDPCTVILSQPAGRALILLVVPPAASTDSATYAMGSAAAGHLHDDPACLLAEAGVAGDGWGAAAEQVRTALGRTGGQQAALDLYAGHLGGRPPKRRVSAAQRR